jgi:hypothetical protein
MEADCMNAEDGMGGDIRRQQIESEHRPATPEDQKSALTPQARGRAAEARRAAIEAGAHYRRDWLDASLWEELAKSRGIRLPQWHRPPTSRALKTWSRNLGNLDFEGIFGCSPSRAIELNPSAPLRAFIGWLLEATVEMERPVALDDAPASDFSNSRCDSNPYPTRGQSGSP